MNEVPVNYLYHLLTGFPANSSYRIRYEWVLPSVPPDTPSSPEDYDAYNSWRSMATDVMTELTERVDKLEDYEKYGTREGRQEDSLNLGALREKMALQETMLLERGYQIEKLNKFLAHTFPFSFPDFR